MIALLYQPLCGGNLTVPHFTRNVTTPMSVSVSLSVGIYLHNSALVFPLQGRGLKISDILKDDENLTAFLLRDAELSESVVHQLVNAKIRLEQVHYDIRSSCRVPCTYKHKHSGT